MDSELHQFPLRMRDWLKNVLVTLYERDLDHNLLTEKQKLRVRTPWSLEGSPGRSPKQGVPSSPLPGNGTQRAAGSAFQVRKIYENEKRLQAGEHSLDLLAHDFKKNYNMYIYPVHWQFGQLDQHPADGYATGRGRGLWLRGAGLCATLNPNFIANGAANRV